MRILCAPALAVLFATCSSTPTMSDAVGQGLVSFDAEPPLGVQAFPRPEWRTGDRIVFLRGGLARDAFTVQASADGYNMVDEQTGSMVLKNLDLGDVGQQMAGESEPTAINAPADYRFHWPLWVGKAWSVHFVQKQGAQTMALIASYKVEAEETLVVPAGTFRTLRILRTIQPATDDPVLPQQSLHWYAPEIGLEARSLIRSLVFELDEYQQNR